MLFDENTLSVYIKRLRAKVEDNPQNHSLSLPKEDMVIVEQGRDWVSKIMKNTELKAI